jgi:hypothetical protein
MSTINFLSGLEYDPPDTHEEIASMLIVYAKSVHGVGSWDLIPGNPAEFYLAFSSGTFLLDRDRPLVFGWDEKQGVLYIKDGHGGSLGIFKNENVLQVVYNGVDKIFGTDDDVRYFYERNSSN